MQTPLLQTKDLSKNYAFAKVVDDISFSLERGEIHAIVGANGAGKSTFVKLLFGEVLPDAGKIFIRGSEQRINSPASALANGIAMVSQDFGLVDSMTIAENIALARPGEKRPIFFYAAQVQRRAKKVLSKLLPSVDTNRLVGDLPASQKQLVSIAKALDTHSDIIIFDEPTSVLGSNSFAIIRDLIRELRSLGKAIIYITHKIDEVFELADAVSVFKNGKIELSGKIGQLSRSQVLEYFNIVPRIVSSGILNDQKKVLFVADHFSTNVFRDVSFSISKGEIVGITSDKIVDAMDLARDIYTLCQGDKKFKTGLITDDRRTEGIFENLTVNDNIGLLQFKTTSKAGFINDKIILENTKQKVQRLDVKCRSFFQPAGELSGGNQQKVLFAREMSYDFDLLILIEPTAGIDLGGKSEIYAILSDLKSKGKSFLLVSSDSKEVENLCDRVLDFNKRD
jgi:ABC-type sugar transport system ATPase subunit